MSRATPLAVVLAAMLAASASAQQPSPVTTTTNAVTRLVNDSGALAATDADAATRSALLARAKAIQKASLKRPCRAVGLVRKYRKLVPRVDDTRTALPEGR